MPDEELKLIANIAENMPPLSEETVRWWLNNPKGLKEFLKGLDPSNNVSASAFKVFKSIELGTNYLVDLRRDARHKGMKISPYAVDILEKPQFALADCKTIVKLAVASVEELGFKELTLLKDIYARIKELGGELCPNEVGIQLRLQYPEQPEKEWLNIAMEPIADSQDCLRIFSVGHGSDYLWLDTCYGKLDCAHEEPKTRFVFALPRK
jgi:hypothetical protein